MYGWSGGTNEATIRAMKQIVHASSFHDPLEDDIAEASQSASCSTRLTVASTFATSSFAFASAFFCLPLIQVLAMLEIGPINVFNIYFSANQFAQAHNLAVASHR